ncbi:hypothetical protein TSAR_013499 [Trichomalopsis sarcophagae]|uniref:Uncharacterized protein n=1 Tax=Trichomalopsis sarcophagae TaxID=543379 RepID=A0A232EY45_9HYME|nr:hypothetical protein TSAR_013499 [Trichomalopsis sarcophagae]
MMFIFLLCIHAEIAFCFRGPHHPRSSISHHHYSPQSEIKLTQDDELLHDTLSLECCEYLRWTGVLNHHLSLKKLIHFLLCTVLFIIIAVMCYTSTHVDFEVEESHSFTVDAEVQLVDAPTKSAVTGHYCPVADHVSLEYVVKRAIAFEAGSQNDVYQPYAHNILQNENEQYKDRS